MDKTLVGVCIALCIVIVMLITTTVHLHKRNNELHVNNSLLSEANLEWEQRYSQLEKALIASCKHELEMIERKWEINTVKDQALNELETMIANDPLLSPSLKSNSIITPDKPRLKTNSIDNKLEEQDSAYAHINSPLSPDVSRLLEQTYCAASQACTN